MSFQRAGQPSETMCCTLFCLAVAKIVYGIITNPQDTINLTDKQQQTRLFVYLTAFLLLKEPVEV